MTVADDALATLRERVARHPADRYPVQHATACFHLGVELANAGLLGEAEEVLSAAMELFEGRLPVEHAKAANARGAVLRLAGRLSEAAGSFAQALEGFRRAAGPLEQATALFNLGLVAAQRGDADAVSHLGDARDLFQKAGASDGAAAAGRELGAALLTEGRLAESRSALEDAIARARAARDIAGVGLGTNLLGLVELADGHPGEAVEAFRSSSAAHPRAVRPDGYAIARANLALAYEAQGEAARARLAAGQALAVPGAPDAARETAEAVLGRLGSAPGALREVLERSPGEQWGDIVRSEMERWVDLDDAALAAEARAWAGALTTPGQQGEEATVAWLNALVELPPERLERLLSAVLSAARDAAGDRSARLRDRIERALVRFPPPQWMRLGDTVKRLSATA